MGYRSDVRMVITGPKERMLAEFASLRLTGDEAMGRALDEFTLAEDGETGAVAILGKDGTEWKWYPTYTDVQAFERIWAHFKGLEDCVEGAFVRIGEEDEDIETRYFGDDPYTLASPTRTVYCRFDGMNLTDIRPRASAP